MNTKTRTLAAIFLDLAIVLSTVAAVGVYFFSGPDVLGSVGTGCLRYFTTDSNILCALSAAVMLVFLLRRLRAPEAPIPQWAVTLKFVGTVSVTVTLMTVVFFLGPTGALRGGLRGYLRFFEGNTFALHFSTPVLAIVSVIFAEKDGKLGRRERLWALTPTVVYSLVYLVLVVRGVWTDWYGFTFGGKLYLAPVSMAVMYLVTWAFAAALAKLRRT